MELQVTITRSKYGDLYATVPGGTLFQFTYRKECRGWLFWLRRELNPEIIRQGKKEFPLAFFKDACRAKYFIKYGGSMPDSVIITDGMQHVTPKKSK